MNFSLFSRFWELFDRFGLWSVNQLSLYYPWNSIAKIGLLKALHTQHEPQSLHTSFHALHLLLPRKLIAQAWCHYIPEHRREKKGKEKMANKGWIVTIFAFKSENMALNRFYKVWTLFTHVHFPHQKTFGILHLIMIISSWMHLRAANPLSIRCAHMCYRSIH